MSNQGYPEADCVDSIPCSTPEEVVASEAFERCIEITVRRCDECEFDASELVGAIRSIYAGSSTGEQTNLVYQALSDEAFCDELDNVVQHIRFKDMDAQAMAELMKLLNTLPGVPAAFYEYRRISTLQQKVWEQLLGHIEFTGDVIDDPDELADLRDRFDLSEESVGQFLCRKLGFDGIEPGFLFTCGRIPSGMVTELKVSGYGWKDNVRYHFRGFNVEKCEQEAA